MKSILIINILIFIVKIANAQTIKLTDHLIYPRLDSTYWEKDYEALNSLYSIAANGFQTCVSNQTDSTRSRFCFNTTLGHIRMDTSLHNFALEKLIGKWEVIKFGHFEITDSILPNTKTYYRYDALIKEQNGVLGFILFADKYFKTELKNIKEIPNKKKRYKILNGRFLATKSLKGYCGATTLGITKEELLILDDHTFRTLAKLDGYLVIKTSIRRMILKKSSAF